MSADTDTDTDTDMDGIPNVWETTYFFSPTGAVASADSDGDGEDNLSEYISGHNPTNPASVFAVSSYDPPATNDIPSVLYWDSVSGRVYGVSWTPNLTVPFSPLTNGLVYPVSGYTDTVLRSGPQHFYRIEVQLGE